MSKKLVFGVGINDANYVISVKESIGLTDGKRKQKLIWICPFYQTWTDMLKRGYHSPYKETYPTYKDVFVNEEWHLFSNFKGWMEQQKWEDEYGSKLQLDKDILFKNNKEYSKEKCIFVPRHINMFLLDREHDRGDWPVGVSLNKATNKFVAYCSNGKGKNINLGYFTDPNEAHLAWKSYKNKLAVEYANALESEGYDSRLVEALRNRYFC